MARKKKNQLPVRNVEPAQMDEELAVQEEEPSVPSESVTPSSRPKRNARASTLYNNSDYELHGQVTSAPKKETTSSRAKRKRTTRSEQTSETVHFNEEDAPQNDTYFPPPEEEEKKVPTLSPVRELPRKRPNQQKNPNQTEESKKISKLPTSTRSTRKEPQARDTVYMDGSNLVVGEDVEIQQDDDGPPVLAPTEPGEQVPINDGDDSTDEEAPNLEMNQPSKKRGRPKRPDNHPDSETIRNAYRVKLPRPPGLQMSQRQKARFIAASNSKNVKVFENELEVAPNGEPCAKVIHGCLGELLRKERICDILTNEEEIEPIRDGGWLLERQPRLPPLTGEKMSFAFFIDGAKVLNPRDLSQDDLRPWSSTNEQTGLLNVKPNVRRHPITRVDGKLLPCKMDPRLAEMYLTEYSSRLPRDLRLRKKIFYVMKDNRIYGNVLIIYDYTAVGVAPSPLSLPHGNDLVRNTIGDGIDETFDNDTPFEQNVIEGVRGGLYLKLRPSKLGWVQNKKAVLDYLVNKPNLLCTEEGTILNNRLPDLPPLIETTGIYVYFVPAHYVANQLHHAPDGLSPWTTDPNSVVPLQPRARSTRRDLFQDADGVIVLGRNQMNRRDFVLVEALTSLARCPRIRKRVIYIQQLSASVVGNVCYVYEFLEEGSIPQLFAPPDLKNYHADAKFVHPTKTAIELNHDIIDTEFDDLDVHPIPEEQMLEDMVDLEGGLQTNLFDGEPMLDFDGQIMEDTLNGGYDDEFPEDPEKSDLMDPFFNGYRALESGHVYLTVRHKKIACTLETVLEWIVNSDRVDRLQILNKTKPGHPPIVSNARAYAFFVAGNAIFPHDINRDDFSPWSHNGSGDNPTCYRTKVRKTGVICERNQFQTKEGDYKNCPFHLVYLYSINPRDPRLRKKIYYVMETQSKMIVSHALIMYDYNVEGTLPRTNPPGIKPIMRRTTKIPTHHDVYNDISDMSETEKESPFVIPFGIMPDGTTYTQVIDPDFWNDRNRQLNYLVNRPTLVKETLQVLNERVPDLPPMCEEKGTFAFFVDLEEVGVRALTVDALVPWSEGSTLGAQAISKRPKTLKLPLSLNRNNQLRVWKTTGVTGDQVSYQLHVYTATLPRCTRLRKKVVYVQKNGRPCGYALIMYWFTESGKMPTPLQKVRLTDDQVITEIGRAKCDYIISLLDTMEIYDVIHHMEVEHNTTITPHIIDIIRDRQISANGMEVSEWTNADGSAPSSSSEIIRGPIVNEEELVVEHTEILAPCGVAYEGPPLNPFLVRNTAAMGFVRGTQRDDAFWRIATKQFGAADGDETFDLLFKLLHERNEARLIENINRSWNVEMIMQNSDDVQNGHYVEQPMQVAKQPENPTNIPGPSNQSVRIEEIE